MRFWNWLLGFVTIKICGEELPRFLRLCSNKGLLVWDVCCGDWNEMIISMRKKDVFLAKDVFKKTKTRFSVVHKVGLPFLILRYQKKAVYFSCITLAVVALLFLSRFIWRVEIVGNSYISEERLLTYLQEKSCGVGILKQSINPMEMEKMMLKDFPEIIWNSVSINGTTLHISVKEQIPNDDVLRDAKEEQDLVSPIQGTVNKVYVRHGTAAVAVGDKVKKGDPLVYGWVPIYDDGGTQILKYNTTEADADVLIEGNIHLKNRIKRSHKNRLYSGRERRYLYYGTSRHKINFVPILYGKHRHTSLVSIRQVYLMDTIPLPIYRNYAKEKEFTFFHEDYTDYELKNLQKRFCDDFIHKMEQKGVQIIDKNVMITYGKNESVMKGELRCLYPALDFAPSEIPKVDITGNDNL